MTTDPTFLGIDIGTSGVRAVIMKEDGTVVAGADERLPPARRDGASVTQMPGIWWQATVSVLRRLSAAGALASVRALAVDGTSGTVLVADAEGRPLGPARLYNDAACVEEAGRIASAAPAGSAALGSGSALARLLWLQDTPGAAFALHQADWIAGMLTGRFGMSDENNALKTGYDPVARVWPSWLDDLQVRRELLPEVVEPGTMIGRMRPDLAASLGFPADASVMAGTTDGCAAFLATGADRVGDGVTSLGSTLVVKLLCSRPIFAPDYGIYSHRLGDLWLAGGASNTGGAVLREFFDDKEMAALETHIDPDHPTGLDYYPLASPGERFPVNDRNFAPRLTPRPADDAIFFQGLLEGMAAIERQGYARLAELGGPELATMRSVGRGAANAPWTAIRRRVLGVPFIEAASQDAACGTARLALTGWRRAGG